VLWFWTTDGFHISDSLKGDRILETVLKKLLPPYNSRNPKKNSSGWAFPDGHSALMLAAARLRHVASTKWGKRRYMRMDTLLNPAKQEAAA